MAEIEIHVVRSPNALTLTWSDRRGTGTCRFDRIPGTTPEWLGSADEILAGATRQQEGHVLDAVARWAETEGLELGVWYDDAGVEVLSAARA